MNIVLTVLGWALWTWIFFNLEKDLHDDKNESYGFWKDYKPKHWEEWIGSLIAAALLLVIGHMGLGLDLIRVIDSEHPAKWSDLYYAASGIFYEAVIRIAKKVKGMGK